MKCRFVCPDSPNDGLLVESLGSSAYDPVEDRMNDDWAQIRSLEDSRSWVESEGKRGAPAGTYSACPTIMLQPVEEVSSRDYAMRVVLTPEGEHVVFPDGAISVEICTHIHGTQMECAAMLQNLAADIMTSIKNEITKGASDVTH